MGFRERNASFSWLPNGTPRNSDRAFAIGLFVAGALFGAVLYLEGYAEGSYLLPSLFVALFVAWVIFGTRAHRQRRPVRIGFSKEGAHIVYQGERTRILSWDTIASVRISRFLGDVAVGIRYVDGRVEDRAHIYGDAALELKRRFDEWKTSSTG